MKIAILSDIHDNIWKLETLLSGLEADVLIFCGDFCAPFTLAQIAEAFSGPTHVVFGNNDGDQFLLARVAGSFPHVSLHGDFAELTIDGCRVAVTHYPEIGRALAQGGAYDLFGAGDGFEYLEPGTTPAGEGAYHDVGGVNIILYPCHGAGERQAVVSELRRRSAADDHKPGIRDRA